MRAALPHMNNLLAQTVASNGFAFIPCHRPDLSTVEAVSLLGTPLTLAGFSTVQELRPHRALDAAPNTYSGNFGVGEFPMHTDLAHWAIPPRYLVLRCIQGASEVSTGLIDGNVLIKKNREHTSTKNPGSTEKAARQWKTAFETPGLLRRLRCATA